MGWLDHLEWMENLDQEDQLENVVQMDSLDPQDLLEKSQIYPDKRFSQVNQENLDLLDLKVYQESKVHLEAEVQKVKIVILAQLDHQEKKDYLVKTGFKDKTERRVVEE